MPMTDFGQVNHTSGSLDSTRGR